jgi:hypothetical protein
MVLKSFLAFVLFVLSLLSNACKDVLSIYLVKENVWKKMFEKIRICTFQQHIQPNSQSPNCYEFTKWGWKGIIRIKSFGQFPRVNDLPQINSFVQHMPQFTLKYTWRISLTNLAKNLNSALILALLIILKFTEGRWMITNSGKLKNAIWEQVAAS